MNPISASGSNPTSQQLTKKEIFLKSLEPIQPVVLIVGPPLSGKSQVANILTHNYQNLYHVALSHEIREFLRGQLTLVPAISEEKRSLYLSFLKDMNEGRLIPDNDFIFERVCECLKNNPRGIVLDGFPRNEAQVILLQKLTKHWSRAPIVIAVDFDHDNQKEVKRRLSKRTRESLAVGEMRSDDSLPIVMHQRIPTYIAVTKPILPILGNLFGNSNFKEISSAVGEQDPEVVQKNSAKAVINLATSFFDRKKRSS